MIMGVILSGNNEEKQTQLSFLVALLAQQCINLDMCEWDISISINGHSQLLIDRASLSPIERCTAPFDRLKESYFIDYEIYQSLIGESKPPVLGKQSSSGVKKPEAKSSINYPYRTNTKTKRLIAKREVISRQTDSIFPKVEDDYFAREENQTCAYAIKQLSEDHFSLFFRSGIIDRGSDTTFRHYLDNRSGQLIIYRYFKSIDSIKMVFSDIGKPLRYNGNNLLSIDNVNYIESQFSKYRYL